MNEIEKFHREVLERIEEFANDPKLKQQALEWVTQAIARKYVYNFTWLGRPIIQTPADIVGIQELIWTVQPDLIVETGIAHGGSLILSASMLELIGGDGKVVGIDIDIRRHNRDEIEKHPMYKRIEMIEGSSIDETIVQKVHKIAESFKTILVILDSKHTHDHVSRELEVYSPLVSVGSYVIVLDTFIEDLPAELFNDVPWGIGNNPKTAVRDFLATNNNFEADAMIENKLLTTTAPSGFLKRIR